MIQEATARNSQVYENISQRWNSDDLLRVRAEIDPMTAQQFETTYRRLRTSKNVNERMLSFELKRLANFFEDLGVLEARGSLDIEWIVASLGGVVTHYWDKWELAAVDERKTEKAKRPDAGNIWANWEALSENIEQRRVRTEGHHPKKRWHRRKHF